MDKTDIAGFLLWQAWIGSDLIYDEWERTKTEEELKNIILEGNR